MRAHKVAVALVMLATVAVLLGVHAAQRGSSQPVSSRPNNAKFVGVGEFRGASLQLHNGDPNHPWEQYVDEIADAGANTICLVVTGYQENCSSTSIFVDLRKTPTDGRIKGVVAHAHGRGLRVVLMPIVLLDNPREGEWRGKIAPTSWDDWWEDYENYVMHYAWLAGESGVDLFMVGSELVSTEADIERWRDLIARVRNAYKGLLSYSANWDHYEQVDFWDDLDIVGMTTYHDLGGENPTVEELVKNWQPISKKITDWLATVNRPVLFTEVGWPNQVTCAKYPWDYYRSSDKPDPVAQANCFEAFFQTWGGHNEVAGYFIWEWRSYPGQDIDPSNDTSYVPCGKPAMEVITKYFRAPSGDEPRPPNLATRPAITPGQAHAAANPPPPDGEMD